MMLMLQRDWHVTWVLHFDLSCDSASCFGAIVSLPFCVDRRWCFADRDHRLSLVMVVLVLMLVLSLMTFLARMSAVLALHLHLRLLV